MDLHSLGSTVLEMIQASLLSLQLWIAHLWLSGTMPLAKQELDFCVTPRESRRKTAVPLAPACIDKCRMRPCRG